MTKSNWCIHVVDIHMITSYGDRYFTNILKDSFKLNSNGYFEFTLLDGQKQYVKSDTVFEYSIAKHLADIIMNSSENTENDGESDENVKERFDEESTTVWNLEKNS